MKRIKIKKYDMTFIYFPVFILSAVSVAAYIIRLFNSDLANKLFFSATVILLCFFLSYHTRFKILKIVLILLAVFYGAAYFIIGNSAFAFAANRFANSASSFGFFDLIFNTAGIYDFQSLVLETSYGGARLINSQIICGVSNIVKADAQSDLIYYLSGRVIFIFALCGILLSDKKYFKANLFIIALMLISGNPSPALILLLFTSPSIYFVALLFNFVSYIAAGMFEIKGAYVVSPSIFETMYHSQNIIFVLAVGFLICAVSYFVTRLVKERKK